MKTGVYKHYKGKKYLVLGVAKHSETLEEMVVYTCLWECEHGPLWCRPKNMFLEEIEKEGQMIKRFQYIGDK